MEEFPAFQKDSLHGREAPSKGVWQRCTGSALPRTGHPPTPTPSHENYIPKTSAYPALQRACGTLQRPFDVTLSFQLKNQACRV